ncbi:phosphotransferase family protein [Conexibacter stalactiti]|uniref:Phosphotransferase family protein n=1 Tax=Conexibacter stalactiti TaxID=1940611 RepID=A0ABU4HIL5_9ACTN|nr:phosphotransferase family protein [Conexibacter stalactiti]MDW5593158.1 phosphotransferase family protein [Conexibacter stalactiti]MEC5033799.1 phosphotransferase family protein [Conexibacter stalactiti]
MRPHEPTAAPALAVDTHREAAALARPPLLVRRPLEALLDRHGIGAGPVEAELVGEGESNVTLVIRRGDARAILRRPPRRRSERATRNVLREARLLELLEPTAARAPRVLLTCVDPAVIGVPFYVMEEVAGSVITSTLPIGLDDADGRDTVARELVDALVELHAIDLASSGLHAIGRSDDFLERHLRRWTGIWERHRTRDVPVLDEVTGWLRSHRPEPSSAPTLVHGDYRLGNVVFAPAGPARLRAVLDWEIASIGDPLCDLAWMLTTWPESDDPAGTLLTMAGAVAPAGFPSRAELAARYAELSGRPISGLSWYTALALWRAAIGLETLRERALTGAAEDAFVRELAVGVPELADRALTAALTT